MNARKKSRIPKMGYDHRFRFYEREIGVRLLADREGDGRKAVSCDFYIEGIRRGNHLILSSWDYEAIEEELKSRIKSEGLLTASEEVSVRPVENFEEFMKTRDAVRPKNPGE